MMKGIAVATGFLCILFSILNHRFADGIWLSFAVTFATIFYHFSMRLVVGYAFDRIMGNKVDYNRAWFQLKPVENRIYKFLKVKKWKAHMPTYNPDVFSPKKHSWDEIAQAMCQAELVHETIVILSFLPIILSIWFDSIGVFVITSACAAVFDQRKRSL